MRSKSLSQIFKILFETGDTNIFVLRGVFLRYIQLRSYFSDEKNKTLQRNKRKLHHWKKFEFRKVVHNAKIH